MGQGQTTVTLYVNDNFSKFLNLFFAFNIFSLILRFADLSVDPEIPILKKITDSLVSAYHLDIFSE